jgi:hypothetical protein
MRKIRSLLTEALAEVYRQATLQKELLATYSKRYRAMQAQRDADLTLCEAYINASDKGEEMAILTHAMRQLEDHLFQITAQLRWLGSYFFNTEVFISSGAYHECFGAALAAMHYYPNRHNFLVEYLGDAVVAATICFIGEAEINLVREGWNQGFAVMHNGFYHHMLNCEVYT